MLFYNHNNYSENCFNASEKVKVFNRFEIIFHLTACGQHANTKRGCYVAIHGLTTKYNYDIINLFYDKLLGFDAVLTLIVGGFIIFNNCIQVK